MKTQLGLAAVAVLMLVPMRARADQGEEHIKLFEQFSDLVDKDKGNCDQMGTDLDKFLDEHRGDLARMKAEGAKMTAEQRQASADKYRDRFHAAAEKMRAGMMACRQNEKVRAAMQRMHQEAGGPGGPGMHHGGMHE